VDGFAEFVREALPGLLRYGHLLTGNPRDAADLAQAVLAKVGARWSSVVRNGGDPVAHTRRAMASCHAGRRWHGRREGLGRRAVDPLENEPVWALLRELSPRQRTVLVLRYYDELSEPEIAAVLGVSRGMVQSQVDKATATLRGRPGVAVLGGVG
jgi:DNA-directed RNA polymerase specialized sigma24 family protein